MVPAGVVASVEFVVATLPPAGFTNTGGNGGFILDLSVAPALSGPLSFDYLFHTPVDDSNIATVTVQVIPPVVHHVSVGGPDICEGLGLSNGCGANFSLAANQKADGSVKGQWQDSFGGVNGSIHVVIDCLQVGTHKHHGKAHAGKDDGDFKGRGQPRRQRRVALKEELWCVYEHMCVVAAVGLTF